MFSKFVATVFQYNTCFYLSIRQRSLKVQKGRFQYNTCFYLSHLAVGKAPRMSPISIQHLFLFILFEKCRITSIKNFNTTLVFIYRRGLWLFCVFYYGFQYNTCFYLSNPGKDCVSVEVKFQYNTCFYLSELFYL